MRRSLEQIIYTTVAALPEECSIEITIRGNGTVDVILFDDQDEARDNGFFDENETATAAVLRLAEFSKSLEQEIKLRRMSQ